MLGISNTRLTKRRLTIGVILVFLTLALTVAVTAVNRLGHAGRTSTAAVQSQSALIQPTNSLEAQRITLRPWGFEPAEVTRPAGRFLLAIDDRSGQQDLNLILLRHTGERLKEVRLRDTRRKFEWREVVNLPPGRYSLVANQEHVCQIVLTNSAQPEL